MSGQPQAWSQLQRWRYALKPASWPKLLVPALLGQALAVAATASVDLVALLLGGAFLLALGVFIVLLNDWGDQQVDRLKRRMFPDDCSPKTIPDAILPAGHLFRVGVLAGLVALALAVVASALVQMPGLSWLGLGCLALFMAYTLPPLRINYRGGGEVLEAVGVGLALPWWQYALQSGQWLGTELIWLAGFFCMSVASALASGLADERSDRAGGKRTLASLKGNAVARRATEAALALGVLGWLWAALKLGVPGWWSLPAVAIVVLACWRLRKLSPTATTNAFSAQGQYKRVLHLGIWYGTAALAAGLLVAAGLP